MRGEAHEAPGYLPGDLIFVIREQPHKTFRRDGVHLFLEKEVPLVNALTGFQFLVQHLDNRKLLIKTSPNDIIKPADNREVRNEGMPVFSRPYEHGNLYIKFKVKFPAKLNANQLTALRSCLPELVNPPQPQGDEMELTLMEVDEEGLNQDRYKGHTGNAYDESDEEEGHGGGVQCAQQ